MWNAGETKWKFPKISKAKYHRGQSPLFLKENQVQWNRNFVLGEIEVVHQASSDVDDANPEKGGYVVDFSTLKRNVSSVNINKNVSTRDQTFSVEDDKNSGNATQFLIVPGAEDGTFMSYRFNL